MPSLARAAAFGLLLASAVTATDPVARIDTGVVVGKTYDLPDAPSSVNKFLGIPFAVSPPERFFPPQPAKKHAKLIVQEKKPACIGQNNYPEEARNWEIRAFNYPPPPVSEDCLYLNVYTPNKPPPPGGWPVLYYIFGGSLRYGSASLPKYDGQYFAGYHDVIVVSGNYRTNVFGFPDAPELPVSKRNLGFLDQQLALDWVQRNIHAFGGDPEKVTIFGNSAGGVSADLHVLMTPKNPPFRAAILQSGLSGEPTGPDSIPWGRLVDGIGCANASSPLKCVQKIPALEIQDYIEHNNVNFRPIADNVTDGTGVRQRRLTGNMAKVPIMVGTSAEEGRVYLYDLGPDKVDDFLSWIFPNNTELQDTVRDLYPLGTPHLETDFEVIAAIHTDLVFNCAAKQLSEDSATQVKTWRYLFNATFSNNQPIPDAGAFHTSELPLVFGTYERENSTAQQVALSHSMMSAWANFAKNPQLGPGWNPVGTFDGLHLGDFGTDGTSGVTVRRTEWVDRGCKYLTMFLPF